SLGAAARSLGEADGLAFDDLVEVRRQAVPDATGQVLVSGARSRLERPLGHAFTDSRDELLALRRRASVAQRDERQDAAAHLPLAVLGTQGRVDRPVIGVV